MNHHHRDCGVDNDFNDPAGWNKAAYFDDPINSIEPLPDISNPYRQAAIYHLGLMYAVDRYMETVPDARLGIIAVAIVLKWPSVRGLSVDNISGQIGCSPSTIGRACARFREMAGLGSAGGGVRFIRPGAGSLNGDKPVSGRV
jgi:hypothetical protein